MPISIKEIYITLCYLHKLKIPSASRRKEFCLNVCFSALRERFRKGSPLKMQEQQFKNPGGVQHESALYVILYINIIPENFLDFISAYC